MPTSTPSLLPNKNKFVLSEETQQNPLRWAIFKYQGDNKFVQQTPPFRCKDYFNDFVAKYHGHEVSIFGIHTGKVEVDSFGMFVGLQHTTPQFVDNLLRVLNPKLQEEFGIELVPTTVDEWVLVLFPRVLFDSTYTISLLTLIIRACNDVTEWANYDHLVEGSLESLILSHKGWLKSAKLLPPEHLRKYWFFSHETYHNETVAPGSYSFSNHVHNTGCFTWKNAKAFATV